MSGDASPALWLQPQRPGIHRTDFVRGLPFVLEGFVWGGIDVIEGNH